jgi:hypothetical protein
MTPNEPSFPSRRRLRRMLRRLVGDISGVALIEFAYSLPFMTILGLGGIELANYSITHMRVSQIAVSLADNASRAKEQITNGVPQMREYDVNEAFSASALQSGSLDIATNGRLILTSLETNSSSGQWLHWQRCFGAKTAYKSSYGKQGDGKTGTAVKGMGPKNHQIKAESGYAIMFAEVVYDYQPIIWTKLVPDGPIRKIAAMYVRDDRDLDPSGNGLFNPTPTSTSRTCPA